MCVRTIFFFEHRNCSGFSWFLGSCISPTTTWESYHTSWASSSIWWSSAWWATPWARTLCKSTVNPTGRRSCSPTCWTTYKVSDFFVRETCPAFYKSSISLIVFFSCLETQIWKEYRSCSHMLRDIQKRTQMLVVQEIPWLFKEMNLDVNTACQIVITMHQLMIS